MSTGKPSLGDLAVVSRLVREFVKYVLDIRAAWHAGEPGARDPRQCPRGHARCADVIGLQGGAFAVLTALDQAWRCA